MRIQFQLHQKIFERFGLSETGWMKLNEIQSMADDYK